MTLLIEDAETASPAATSAAEIGAPLVPQRSRHHPRRDRDRWSRWADEAEQMEDAVA